MTENKAFRSGIGYTIGNILIKGINFLSLPIFSRLMSTEEFGVYNVFVSYDAFLSVIVGLALHSSIKSAHYEFEGEIDRYTSCVSLVYIINALIFAIVGILFSKPISSFLGISPTMIFLLVLMSFSNAVISLYNNRISLEYSYKKYLFVSACSSFFNVAASLVLMYTVYSNQKVLGRILGATLPQVVIVIFLLVAFYRKALPKFKKKYLNFGIKYSLPIVPHGISQILLGQYDRILIRNLVGDAAAGIFSLAGNLKLILTIITESISTAWSTWFFEEMDKNNIKNIQKKATQLTVLFVILSVGFICVSPEIILILGGKEYSAGKYVAIPMLVDGFVLFLYNVISPSEYYTKKTVYIMSGTIFAAIINAVLTYIFVDKYGFIAAGYTTLFAYICYLLLHIIISRKFVKFFVIPIKWLLFSSFIVLIMATISLIFVDFWLIRWSLCLLVVLIIAYFLIKNFIKEKN